MNRTKGWLTVSLLPKHITWTCMTLLSCNNILVLPLLFAKSHARAVALGGTTNFHCVLLQKQHNGTIVTKSSLYMNATNKRHTQTSPPILERETDRENVWERGRGTNSWSECLILHNRWSLVYTMLPPSEHPGFISLALTTNLDAVWGLSTLFFRIFQFDKIVSHLCLHTWVKIGSLRTRNMKLIISYHSIIFGVLKLECLQINTWLMLILLYFKDFCWNC